MKNLSKNLFRKVISVAPPELCLIMRLILQTFRSSGAMCDDAVKSANISLLNILLVTAFFFRKVLFPYYSFLQYRNVRIL